MFDGGAMRQRVQFVGTEEHMQRMGVFGAAVVLIGLVLSAALSGQPVARAATLDDLLVELRGLRADLKATSAASVRAQALVARAALQEQRLRAVSEQLNRVQSQLSAITMEREEAEEQLRDLVAAPVVGNPMNRDVVIAQDYSSASHRGHAPQSGRSAIRRGEPTAGAMGRGQSTG